MLCPVCAVDLVLAERQGIEIDYCPSCRGVWLDRGELDKIIERSQQFDTQTAAPPATEYTKKKHSTRNPYAQSQEADSDYGSFDDFKPKRVLHKGGKKHPYRGSSRYERDNDNRSYDRRRDDRSASSKAKDFLEDIFDFF